MKFIHQQLVLFLLLTLFSCQDTDQKREQKELELKKTISVFNTAFKEGDLQVLDSLTTKDYRHTNGSSKVIDKTAWFGYLKKRTHQIRSKSIEILAYEFSEVDIKIQGNTAIVTGKVLVNTKDTSGIRERKFRVTHVWLNDSGVWKRAAFHDGKIE